MKASELAVSQKGYWRDIAITPTSPQTPVRVNECKRLIASVDLNFRFARQPGAIYQGNLRA
jgi:hypothetical protein